MYLLRQKAKMKKEDVRQNFTALQPSLIQYNTTIPAVGDSSYAVIKNVQITGCSMCKEQDSHFCMKGTRFIYLSSNILSNHRKTQTVCVLERWIVMPKTFT